MNNLTSVERVLQDLKPRNPSPELKSRIFEPRETAPTEPAVLFNLVDFTRFLVPVTGCFLVAMASLGSNTTPHNLIESTNDLMPQANKARYSAYVGARAFHTEMNTVPVTRMEWNFGGSASSTAQVVLQFTTNLMR